MSYPSEDMSYSTSSRSVFSENSFAEAVDSFCLSFLSSFKSISRGYLLFHTFFFCLAIGELFALIFFFPFFTHSSILAFTVAALFLTLFSYFILLFYFQEKKPLQLQQLQENFLSGCQNLLPFEKSVSSYHLFLVQAVYRLFFYLRSEEELILPIPSNLKTLASFTKKAGRWAQAQDRRVMGELLLRSIISELVEWIKTEPTDLEAHTQLAQAYVTLASLYSDSFSTGEAEESSQAPAEGFSDKFEKALLKAVEEFKIVASFASQTPWAHAQLAALYHKLDKPAEEIAEYETILSLVSQDNEVLFRLGTLYFSTGQNAKGLAIYKTLLQESDPRAAELITRYGAFHAETLSSSEEG